MKKLEVEVDSNEEYTVSEIVEKFKHFKNLLLNLAKTSEVPLNIEGNFFKQILVVKINLNLKFYIFNLLNVLQI